MATTIQQIELPKKARAVDTSGNNNHGQIYSGRGLEFDGVSDNLTTGSDIEGVNKFSDGTAWTITLWVYFTGEASAFYIGDEAATYSMLIKESTEELRFREVTGGAFHEFNENNTINLNTWYRQTVVCNGTTITCHLNGEIWGSAITPSSTLMYFTGIGNPYESGGARLHALSGMMSDFQVWDSAWSTADVTYDYLNPESLALNNSGTALTESNLKLWYPMQDGHRGQQSYILDGANTGAVVELVTNGDFATDSAWTKGTSWSISGGTANFDDTATSGLSQNMTFVSGKTYRISFEVISGTASIGFYSSNGATSYINYQVYSIGTHNVNFLHSTGANLGIFGNKFASSAFSIDNVSVKQINDKHHATTVFYGDDLVIGNDATHAAVGNWTGQNAATVTGGYDSGDTDHATTLRIQAGDTGSERAELAQGSLGTPTVAGRTYLCTFDFKWIDNTDITANTPVNIGGSQLSGAYGIDFDASGWTAYSQPFIAADSTTPCRIYVNDSGHADNEILIDNFSLKEVGVASGWTDADQQLHIPQTALQSYNELAWFDGTSASNGYVDLDTEIATANNDWSLSFWVYKLDTGAAYNFIFAANASTKNISLDNNGNERLSYRATGNAYHVLSDAALPHGEWIHVVITANADTSMTAYINGVAQTTNSDMSDTELVLSRFMNGYSNDSYNVLGTVNEISYYSDVLTSAEALDLFNDGKAKSALELSGSAELVGYWRNNGLSEWKDLKGSNDGNTSAGVVETILIPQGVDSTRDAQGFIMNRQKSTSCLNLTNEAYVDSPTGGFVGTSDFSVSCWFKTTDSNAWLLMKGEQGGGGKRYALYIHGSNYLTAEIDDNSTFVTWNGSATVNDGDWHHAVVTFDRSGNGQIYLDGSTDGSATSISSSTGSLDPTNHRDFTVGVNSNDEVSGPYTGQVDGVLIYTKALSLTEVEKNYNATKGNHRN